MLVLAIFLNFLFNTLCVKREKFKTCSQSGFCNRAFETHLHENRFIAKDISCKNGLIESKLFDDHFKVELILRISALQENRVRIFLTESSPKYPRYNIWEHAWKDIQDEPLVNTKTSTLKVNSTFCQLIFSNKYSVSVDFVPFLITVKDSNGEHLITFNKLNSFYIEPHIEKLGDSNDEDSPDSDRNIPSESFDGHTDDLPRGYKSVSFDCIFHDFKHIFGLPEHASSFSLDTNKALYRLFNLDVFEFELYNTMALYGSVPFVVAKNVKHALGLLFLNAAEMWVSLNKVTPSQILSILGLSKQTSENIETRWVAESGVIDIIIMLGNEPKDVLHQYSLTTGFPNLPPIFSTAYHQCRWNYNDQNDVANVDAKFDELIIPYDVIWLDIEHTPHRQYFLFDKNKFPDHYRMVRELNSKGRKLVTVVDPHVKKSDSYFVYNEVIALNFQTNTSDNSSSYVGWCWPGDSIYPDYMRPEVRRWYAELFDTNKYEGTTDGVHTWVDMNEPSVFNGPEVTVPKGTLHGQWENRDLHNLYGQMCINASYGGGLVRSKNRLRPFVLSRSFFAGSQRYGAIWTGDNKASWDHLQITIPMLLSVSIAGIPFVGADVSGFFGDPSSELFIRWYQAASMQPFFRAHAHIDTKRREPWSYGSPTTEYVKEQILRRYRHLPYIYTLFHEAASFGTPIMRPLWFEFPDDANTLSIEDSYLLGSSILIKPIVHSGVSSLSVYLPTDSKHPTIWYSVVDDKLYKGGAEYVVHSPNLAELPIFYRGGSIIPIWLRQRRSSNKMIHDPVTLIITLDTNNQANGTLYIDDGESFDYLSSKYALINFEYKDGILKTSSSGSFASKIWIERIIIHGSKKHITSAQVSSKNHKEELEIYKYISSSYVIRKPGVKLLDNFTIKISSQ